MLRQIILQGFLSLLLLQPPVLQADTLTLRACFRAGEEHLPFGRRTEALRMMHNLQTENIATAWLPSLSLIGTASLQSDVVTIPINIPNIEIPSPAKDQYGFYLEARQSIYDAGMTRARKELEEVNSLIDVNEVNVSIEQTRRLVSDAWFSIALIRQRKMLLQASGEELQITCRSIRALYDQGVLPQKSVLQVEAALSGYRQQVIELKSLEQQAMLALSLLTGLKVDTASILLMDFGAAAPQPLLIKNDFNTAENRMFELRAMQLTASRALAANKRLPVVAAWGRAGYGRPGLNMLSDEFNPYFILGATASWEVWDWRRSRRELETIALRREDLNARHDLYLNAQDISRRQIIAELEKYPALIAEARNTLELRMRLEDSSAEALKEGYISADDYLKDFNELVKARLELELQEVLKNKTLVKYALLMGNEL